MMHSSSVGSPMLSKRTVSSRFLPERKGGGAGGGEIGWESWIGILFGLNSSVVNPQLLKTG